MCTHMGAYGSTYIDSKFTLSLDSVSANCLRNLLNSAIIMHKHLQTAMPPSGVCCTGMAALSSQTTLPRGNKRNTACHLIQLLNSVEG